MNTNTDTGWSKDDPNVDAVYWWRADANDPEPDIHSVVAGQFYQIGARSGTTVKNFGGEWLGPISPSDFEQLLRLREKAAALLDHIFSQSSSHEDVVNAAAALRESLKESSREHDT